MSSTQRTASSRNYSQVWRPRNNWYIGDTDHFRLKYDEKYTLGDFSKVIRERPNGADKLTLAFEELLSIFKHAPHAAEQQESLVEAGCWPCLASRSTTWETANESPQRSDDESDDQLHNTQALPEDDNRHKYEDCGGRH